MKKALIGFLIGLVISIVIYLAISFALFTLNPKEWSVDVRGLYAFLALMSFVFGQIFTYDFNPNSE